MKITAGSPYSPEQPTLMKRFQVPEIFSLFFFKFNFSDFPFGNRVFMCFLGGCE